MLEVLEGLTFDDVLLIPAFSDILPREARLGTRLTREVSLNIPLVSAAMDTVTEARLAITIAQAGGLGIIHKNMPVERQASEVRSVKKYESGVIKDPITVSPDTTIREVLELTRTMQISGVPVVEGGELVGIVTHRDLRFETRYGSPVSLVMTPRERLVTVRGRDPSLRLGRAGSGVPIFDWAREIVDAVAEIAEVLDATSRTRRYAAAVRTCREALDDPQRLPSARVLDELRSRSEAFFEFAMRKSEEHRASLLA